MPELPEVETVMRGLETPLVGQTITRVDQRRPDLRFPFPKKFKQRVEGQTVECLRRRAKYILMDLSGGETMILHLGMSGRVTIYDSLPEPGKHDHLILETEGGTAVVYNDPRRFGLVELANQNEIEAHRFFARMGPEPLGNDFSGPVLYQALKARKTPIKSALLDQRVVAGLGNIYVCDALYYAGIRPTRRTDKVTKAEAEKLAVAIRDVLTRAIAAGGSSLKDYRKADGELGYFQHAWAVYDKEGQKCPDCGCDQGVKRITQSGRSSFYCPVWQT